MGLAVAHDLRSAEQRRQMNGSSLGWIGFLGLAHLLAGCSGSLSFAMRAPGSEQDARACVPADRAFEASTLGWERRGRQQFEDQARTGAVVVRAAGCGWTVLPGCQLDAKYAYRALPVSRERTDDGKELGVEIGGGSSASRGGARPSGTIKEVAVAGVFELGQPGTSVNPHGACAGATHVVARYTVGAFRLDSGRGRSAAVQLPYGGRIENSTWKDHVVEVGQIEACNQAHTEQPPSGCSSSIELDIVPLAVLPDVQPATASTPAPMPVVTAAAGPLAVDSCASGSDEACMTQCRSGLLTGCTVLATRCAGGSVAACLAASATSVGRLLSANP